MLRPCNKGLGEGRATMLGCEAFLEPEWQPTFQRSPSPFRTENKWKPGCLASDEVTAPSLHSSLPTGARKGAVWVTALRAGLWDGCARAASGSWPRDLFDSAHSVPSEVSVQMRRAGAVAPSAGELFDATAPGSRKLLERSPAGRPSDRSSSSPGRPVRVTYGWTD